MNKNDLIQMAKKLDCNYESGVWADINFHLENNKKIFHTHKLSFDDGENIYTLKMLLKNYSKQVVREFFKDLLFFIGYSNVFYVCEQNMQSFDFYLLSSPDDKVGYLLHIMFFKKK